MASNWDSFQSSRSVDESITSNPWENNSNNGSNLTNLVAPNPISPILSHQSQQLFKQQSQIHNQQHDEVASIISSLNGNHSNILSNQSNFLNSYKNLHNSHHHHHNFEDSAIMSDSGSDALRDAISAISAPVAANQSSYNKARLAPNLFGPASVTGVATSFKNPVASNSSFLEKFASVTEKTRELESSHTNNLNSRRSSFFNNSNSNSNVNLSMDQQTKSPQQLFREPRKQSFSEKLESYISATNSPNASRHLSFSSEVALQTSEHNSIIMNDPNGSNLSHNANFKNNWNPATATTFHPNYNQPPVNDVSFMQQQSMMLSAFQANNGNGLPPHPMFFSPQMFPPFMSNNMPVQMGNQEDGATDMKPSDTLRSEYGSNDDDDNETAILGDENDDETDGESALRDAKTNDNARNQHVFPVGLNRPLSPYVMPPFNPYNMFNPNNMIPSPGSPLNSPPIHPQMMIPNSQVIGMPNQMNPKNRKNGRNDRSNSPKNSRSPISFNNKKRGNNANKFKSKHIVRSPLLEEFINNESNKTYTLNDISSHGYEFAKDQYGSRFIQQQLSIIDDETKELFFKEIRNDSMDLITDVFGNYVIQKYFEFGTEIQKKVLFENMRGSFNKLSLHMYGCRVVQRCLEGVSLVDQMEIMEEVKPNILNLVKDQNGNHVIQKAIEQIPIDKIPFILDSLKDQIYHLSMHPYGCRVIQRLLECSNIEDQEFILNELKGFIYYLVQDQFGNYVIQHVIEKGEKKDSDVILNVILDNLIELSKHKFASNAVEKCIINLPEESKVRIYETMLKDNLSKDSELDEQSNLMLMIKDPFANYVVQKMVELIDVERKKFLVAKIRQYLKLIQKNNHGKHLASIEKLNHICRAYD